MEVVAAVIYDGPRILLTRRGPGREHAGFWEFPGGKVEEGETPEAALAREIAKEAARPDFLIVTPGVRPAGADLGDQQRVATPAAALTAGASHLVVARPVIADASPMMAAARIAAEMSEIRLRA